MFKIKLIIFFLLLTMVISAQKDTIKYEINATGVVSSGKNTPFWLQSLNYGKIYNSPNSALVSTLVYKDYNTSYSVFKYAFKAEVLAKADGFISASNTVYGNNSQTGIYVPKQRDVYFQQLYIKAKLLGLSFIAGAQEEILGSQDSTLSSGGFAFSRNSRPIPKITIGFEDFTAIPSTGNQLFIKGGLSHGWFQDNAYVKNVLLHHKYFYFRASSIYFPAWLEAGIEDHAQWGGTLPNGFVVPVNIKSYFRVFRGKQGSSGDLRHEQINALGNHVITQNIKAGIKLNDYRIIAYWQNLSEDGPLKIFWGAMNKEDGLLGISIKNKKFPIIQGLLYEYLNSTDQSGPYHDRDGMIFGGNDGYFLSFPYQQGWTYFGRTIGTPFITSPVYNTNGSLYTSNNKLFVHHFGLEGQNAGFNYKLMSSFSTNYGLAGNEFTSLKSATSLLFEINKGFGAAQNTFVKVSVGADFGQMYGNSVGCMISLKRTGNLFLINSMKNKRTLKIEE